MSETTGKTVSDGIASADRNETVDDGTTHAIGADRVTRGDHEAEYRPEGFLDPGVLADPQPFYRAAQRQGATVEDWAHVVLEYPALRVILHAGMLAAGGSHRFTVHGETGTLLKRAADRQEDQLRAGMIPGAPGWGEDPDDLLLLDGTSPPLSSPAPAGDHRAFYAALREALLGRAPNPVRPDEALAVMAVLDAAARAASTGNAAIPVSGA